MEGGGEGEKKIQVEGNGLGCYQVILFTHMKLSKNRKYSKIIHKNAGAFCFNTIFGTKPISRNTGEYL